MPILDISLAFGTRESPRDSAAFKHRDSEKHISRISSCDAKNPVHPQNDAEKRKTCWNLVRKYYSIRVNLTPMVL